MKKIVQIFIYLLNIILCFNSCKELKNKNSFGEKNKEKVVKIIPKNKYGGEFYPYKMVQRDTKKIDLPSIDSGYDSIFIRVWNIYRFDIKIIDFKKKAGWEAEFHNIKQDLNSDTFKIATKNSKKIFPKTSFDKFTQQLFALNILDLPDDNELKSYNVDADSYFVIVEIATKKIYKIYSYTEPKTHLEFPEAKNMYDILKLIEYEFGVKLEGDG